MLLKFSVFANIKMFCATCILQCNYIHCKILVSRNIYIVFIVTLKKCSCRVDAKFVAGIIHFLQLMPNVKCWLLIIVT